MGQTIPARRRAVPYLRQRPRVVAKTVADVIQTQGMGQMCVEHGDHMAVGAKGTRLDYILAGKIFYNSG